MPSDKKRSRDQNDRGARKPRQSNGNGAESSKAAASASAPRPAPSFVSTLQNEEGDFPRGGGTSLTAFEVKQVREEGRREADAEAAAEAGSRPAKKPKRQQSEREMKRAKKNVVKEHQHEEGQIRVEHLNYKRLVPGTRVLARVHTVLPLHLILSLPNNLLAHVPITEISSTLTKLLSAEQDAMSVDGDDEDKEDEEDDKSSAPELTQLFAPGQYFTAKVLNLYPTASQSFISQYPVTETTRLAARLEATLVPEKVNSEVAKADLSKGYVIMGEVKEEEDKGWRISLGLGEEAKGIEGWLSRDDVLKHAPGILPGQLIRAAISGTTAGGRVIQLTVDPAVVLKAQLNEVSDVASILPGQQASVLVTAVAPNGLNVKVCGFFDGTIDFAHLGLGEADIEDKFKIGKKIRARILYDNLAVTPRRFGLSVLPHVLDLTSPLAKDGKTMLEAAIPIGKVFNSVTVQRVMQEWGVLARTDDGLEGFVHISHVADERVPSLSSTSGPYAPGTLHRARVIGHSPLDGVVLLSFEQKVLDQVFMTVNELTVGQHLRGTIHRLSDKAMFVNISGSVHGVVWPNHYADIQLKHPEKRFKVGGTVKARVFELDVPRSRVVLTLKRSLVDSELEIPKSVSDIKQGMIMPAVVSKLLEKGCIVDLFGGVRAFVPQSEASQSFITNLSTLFNVGKPVNVRIIEIQSDGRLVASVRQALPSALAAEALDIGNNVVGQVSQIHSEQVVVTLVPSQATALLSLSNLSNHRHMGVDELRKTLKIGEKLDDLVIVSKNPQSGLYIVANKKDGSASTSAVTNGAAAGTGAGISKQAITYDSLEVGQQVSGKVITHAAQAAVVLLAGHVKAKLHPCDVADDYDLVKLGPEGAYSVDDRVNAQVIKVNPHARIVDLSSRPSRSSDAEKAKASKIRDVEISTIKDLKVGQKIRGFVKNIAGHGIFVALGRSVTARVMIKELFDDFVKDWQSRFSLHQLVEGKITSVNAQTEQVEMTFKKKDAKAGKASAKFSLNDFSEGQLVTATVKKVEAFGMFLQLQDSDVSGLCHKSEIADSKKADVAKALQGFRPGDQVKAKILKIDAGTKKISLGIKASYFAEDGEAVASDAEEEDGEDVDDEEVDEAASDEDAEDEDDEDVLKFAEDSEDEEGIEGLMGSDDEDDDAEEEDSEDDDEEAEDGDEDEENSDVDVEINGDSAPSAKKTKSSAPIPSLNVAGGFDWAGTGNGADADDSDSGSESSDDEDAVPAPSAKAKGKGKSKLDLTAGAADEAQPESSAEFERALLASPNSSFLWIQYMAFLLQLHEVDRARKIGRQALEKIAYREETEKLNVWMALVNLELGFGTQESADKVFKEAAQYNDARTVYTRYAEALVQSEKTEAAEEILGKLAKKFSAYPESWTRFTEFYLKKGDKKAARALLTRATKSLDKTKHVELLKSIAILECKYDDVERGKTMFEGLLDRYPRRLDLWAVYIDQIAKTGDIQSCRGIIERALDRKLTAKKAKFLFKKWLALEDRIGDDAGQEAAKGKAREWVAANAARAEEESEDEE